MGVEVYVFMLASANGSSVMRASRLSSMRAWWLVSARNVRNIKRSFTQTNTQPTLKRGVKNTIAEERLQQSRVVCLGAIETYATNVFVPWLARHDAIENIMICSKNLIFLLYSK